MEADIIGIELRNDSSEENIGRKAAADPLPPLHVPKARRRLKNVRAQNQPTLTEYFPVRRSVRRCKKTVLEEKQQLLEDAVRSGREDGLLVLRRLTKLKVNPSIDATAETGRLGRLVNHSRNGNLVTRTISIDNIPRLVLVAKDDIRKGEEVLYDYGDRSKESLIHHPWLAN
ncbi:unnamed protein product [Phaedon cochleariae]|uniref:SET domain-containing protein n=1 Tax=Phaedon cochleariae TaxID=80249 RepID=A0A9N9X3G0_PHACE|nr:unnamed protein product [Phaedon cochleariae]